MNRINFHNRFKKWFLWKKSKIVNIEGSFRLRKSSETLNAHLYNHQLQRVHKSLVRNRQKKVLRHVNKNNRVKIWNSLPFSTSQVENIFLALHRPIITFFSLSHFKNAFMGTFSLTKINRFKNTLKPSRIKSCRIFLKGYQRAA